MFAIESKNNIIIKKLTKLFEGDESIISQIITDCNVIIDILKKFDNIPNKFIVKEISNSSYSLYNG